MKFTTLVITIHNIMQHLLQSIKFSPEMIDFEGELDMANPRHVFKPEGNSWIQQLEDQIVLGPSHVFEYIKTDGYKRFVAEDKS